MIRSRINKYHLWLWEGMRWRWQRYWTRLRNFMKSKFNKFLRIFNLSHHYQIYREHGMRFYVYRQQVNRTQWYSRKKIKHYQITRLKKILLHAYENVPYYKKLFDSHDIKVNDIKSIDQLSIVPVLEKELVKKNTDDFIAENISKYKCHQFRTSGSTGIPLELFVDKNLHTFALSITWRDFNSIGYSLNSRCVTLLHPFGYKEGKINRKDLWEYNELINILDINTALIESENIRTICEKIAEFNPECIKTYPSFAYSLALYLQNKESVNIKPKVIITGTEKLYPEQKRLIQEVFDCEVYDFYAQWELLMFANSCSHGNLHTTPELGILEILKNGKKCNKGETGELVCTTLLNRSMPLLRYATGDYGYIEDMECPCGKKSEIVEIVGSRDKDLLVTKNGFVNVMSGTPWFGNKSRIKKIQFFQEQKGNAIVRFVPDEDFDNNDFNNLKESLDNYFNDSVNKSLDLSFEIVNDIPRTAAGKYKYVESKVPIEW